MSTPRAHHVWYGHASSEGGPILVADVESYAAWQGSKEVWADDAVYRIHSYGPLIARLPVSFQPSGAGKWHQYHCVKGIEAARAYVREMRAAAEQLEPTLAMREQKRMKLSETMQKARASLAAQGAGFVPPLEPGADPAAAQQDWLSSWRDHIEGGADFLVGDQRMLHVDAKPDTDYARACEKLEGDTALVRFGDGGGSEALVWNLEGAGTADVALSKEGFLLMRSWLDTGEREREARRHAVAATEEDSAGELTFSSGRVAIVWAPVVPRNLVGDGDPRAALRAAADLNPPVQLNQNGILGVGTAIRVPPGAYAITVGSHKETEWSCRWARFTRVAWVNP